jgi:hypothetical protein
LLLLLLLAVNKRRQSRPTDTQINQLCFVEEDFLLSYRNCGLIRARYIGQNVEIDRKRQLRLQEEHFATLRVRAFTQVPRSSAAIETDYLHSGTDESDSN